MDFIDFIEGEIVEIYTNDTHVSSDLIHSGLVFNTDHLSTPDYDKLS